MKRLPLFFWIKNVLRAYAKLHEGHHDTKDIVLRAGEQIRQTPLKYYFISVVCFFLFEYILPLFFGWFPPFSKLPQSKALFIVETLQHHRFYVGRLFLVLCKSPVLCALNSYDEKVFHEV